MLFLVFDIFFKLNTVFPMSKDTRPIQYFR